MNSNDHIVTSLTKRSRPTKGRLRLSLELAQKSVELIGEAYTVRSRFIEERVNGAGLRGPREGAGVVLIVKDIPAPQLRTHLLVNVQAGTGVYMLT